MDFDGNGDATWREFGRQFRDSPELTTTPDQGTSVSLAWTSPTTSHWTPQPTLKYSLSWKQIDAADFEILADDLSATSYTHNSPGTDVVEYLLEARHDGYPVAYSPRAFVNPAGSTQTLSSELSSLRVSGSSFSVFSGSQTNYEVTVPHHVESTLVTAVPVYTAATVSISDGSSNHQGTQRLVGLNDAGGVAKVITVTVTNGTSNTVYSIAVFREPHPPLDVAVSTPDSIPTSANSLQVDYEFSQPVTLEEKQKMLFSAGYDIENGHLQIELIERVHIRLQDNFEGDVVFSITPDVVRDIYGTLNSASTAAFPVDRKSPHLISANALEEKLTLHFHEQLDSASIPNPSSFSLKGTDAPTISAVSLGTDGESIELALSSALESAQSLTVDYTPPPTNFLRDELGNAVESISRHRIEIGTSLLLASLTLSEIEFDVFSRDVTEYSLDVPYHVLSTAVEAIPLDDGATVTIADGNGSIESRQRTTSLSTGVNDISITVSSEERSDTRIYSVVINRSSDSVDYDVDDDGLIDVSTLPQLSAIRYDLDGDGSVDSATDRESYVLAYPSMNEGMGCPASGCTGYELTSHLTFSRLPDVDAEATDPIWNPGEGWIPIGESGDVSVDDQPFTATFEGRGKIISYLSIVGDEPELTKGGGGIGLFGLTSESSVIRQVGLDQTDISTHLAPTVAGALVGVSRGQIEECYATGSVRAESVAGGLVGKLMAGSVVESRSGVNVGSYAATTWNPSFGGIVGEVVKGRIENSYATGLLQGKLESDNGSTTGGIYGSGGNSSDAVSVVDSYSTSPQLANNTYGIGPGRSGITVTSSYSDFDTSGFADSATGVSQSTEALQVPTGSNGIYQDWDASIWNFGTTSQYPALTVDFGGDGEATWQEFGYQVREAPALSTSVNGSNVELSWTGVQTHWDINPEIKYTVRRLERNHSETTMWSIVASKLGTSSYTFTNDHSGDFAFQVSTLASNFEISHSQIVLVYVSPDETEALLQSLSLSNTDIGVFSSEVTSYSVSVPNDTSNTEVNAVPKSDAATISIADSSGTTSGNFRVVNLAEGVNTITVTVTAADGQTTSVYTVTVTREPPLPIVTVEANAASVIEGNVAAFTLKLNEAARSTLTVSVAVSSVGDALSSTASQVVFASGESSKLLSLATVNDDVIEPDVVVVLTLIAGFGYEIGTDSSATMTVLDNDWAEFSVSSSLDTVDEGATSSLTVSITNGKTFSEQQKITLNTSGTATVSDYTLFPSRLTLSKGVSSTSTRLQVIDDQLEEEAETLTISASHNGQTIGTESITIPASDTTLSDDATLSDLSLSGIDIGPFSSDDTSYDADVSDDVTSTTVTATVNHEGASVEIADGAGTTAGNSRVVNLSEGSNAINVTVTAENGIAQTVYRITVTRATSLPIVTVEPDQSTVVEGTDAAFTLNLNKSIDSSMTVSVTTTSTGSFLKDSVTFVTVDSGETSASFSLATDDDTVVEPAGSATITLVAGFGYALGSPSVATVQTNDNDSASFSVTADPISIEEGGTSTIAVAISNGVTFSQNQTLELSASGTASNSDYTLTATTVILPAGSSEVSVTLRAVDDAIEEEFETVTIEVDHDGSSVGSTTVSINANDVEQSDDATLSSLSLSDIDIGTFSSSNTSYSADVDNDVVSTTVTAVTNDAGATVVIEDANGSSEGSSRFVNLAEGVNSITITVTAEDGDTQIMYTVTVTRASTIPIVTIAPRTVSAGEGYALTFDFRLSKSVESSLTVNIEVTTTGDFLTGTATYVSFDPDTTTKVLRLPTEDDNVVEANGDATVTIQTGTGYILGSPATASVDIQDNDEAEFSVTADPVHIEEGTRSQITVEIVNNVTFAEDQVIELSAAGTATKDDYRLNKTIMTLSSGNSSTNAKLRAVNDDVEEDDETVTVTATLDDESIGDTTVTILANDEQLSDDATLSGLTLSGVDIGTFDSADTIYEGNVANDVSSTMVTATVNDENATVVIADANGSTEASTRTVVLAEGANTITVTVTAEDETTQEFYTVTVTRATTLPVVTIVAESDSVSEGTQASFKLSLDKSQESNLEVSVNLEKIGDAVTGTTSLVTFGAGETSNSLSLTTDDDSVVEGSSSVTATIAASSNYAAGTPSSASVSVLDNDSAAFSATANPTSIEEGSNSTFTVDITNGVTFAEAQSISLSTSGTASTSDYSLSQTTLSLPAGSSSVAVEIRTVDDEQQEDAETVIVAAAHDAVSIGSATVTIEANDAPLSTDATLSSLSLSGVDIGTFSSETTAYSGEVVHDISTTTVTASANDDDAAVVIEDSAGTTEGSSRDVNLVVGTNSITITVTAEDQDTEKVYTVNVTRAAAPPVVSLESGEKSSVTEGEPLWYRVILDRPATSDFSVFVKITETGDVVLNTGVFVHIDEGDEKASSFLSTIDDSIIASDSEVTAELESRDHYELGSPTTLTMTVMDNDEATFTVGVDPESIDEGDDLTITVAIDNDVTYAEDQSISLVTSGSASSTDFTLASSALTLTKGTSSVSTTLTATDDEDEEEAETITVTASLEDENLGSSTATIMANDAAVDEDSDDATLSALTLSGVDIGTFSSDDVSYTGSVANAVTSTIVTATTNDDSASVVIADADGSTDGNMRTVNLVEGENTITLTVTAEDDETQKLYTVTVSRAVSLPVVTITADDDSVEEGTDAVFIVSLNKEASSALEISVDVTKTGDAVTGTATSISMGIGATSASMALSTDDDSTIESDSSAKIELVSGTTYTVGTPSSASVDVTDNDSATYSISAAPTSIEEGGPRSRLTVSITNDVTFADDQTISLSTVGTADSTDFRLNTTSLTLVAGTSSTTANLRALEDTETEDAETVIVTATHAGQNIGPVTITILANEAPSDDATLSALTLSGIDIGTFSSDVVSYRGSVANDVTSTTVTATVNDDGATTVIADANGSTVGNSRTVSLAEGANAITVTVTAEDETTESVYTVTVTRASALPVATISSSSSTTVTEGDDVSITLLLDKTATSAVTVQVKVTIQADDIGETTTDGHTIAAGSRTKDFTVTPYDDNVIESDRDMTVSIETGTGYVVGSPSSLDFTVENDDTPEFSVTADPTNLEEGEESTVTVAITNGTVFSTDQSIPLTVSGTVSSSDYRLRPSPLTFVRQASSATSTFKARNDSEDEDPETATVTAAHNGADIGSATITIGPEIVVNDDATLSNLTVSDVDIGTFSAEETSYSGEAAKSLESTVVQVKVSNYGARVRITDANGRSRSTERTVALSHGVNTVTIRVTATDETTRKTYTLGVTRVASNWGNRSSDDDIELTDVTKPRGIWANDEILWVANSDPSMIYAFTLSDGTRNASRDITPTGISSPSGLWSDGTIVWVGDWYGGEVLAFKLADGTRQSDKDLDDEIMTEAGNDKATGLWSDGEKMWVADREDNWVYVYDLDDGTRQAGDEIDMTDPGPLLPRVAPSGLWSDTDKIFTCYWFNHKILAYRLTDRKHHPPRDIDVSGAGVQNPTGLWSDGETMWVAPQNEAKLYAFEVPGLVDSEESTGSIASVSDEFFEVDDNHLGQNTSVYIEDTMLRKKLEHVLDIEPDDVIGELDMESIASLDLSGSGVANLIGLDYAINLRGLDISSNPIDDLRPIEGLSRLTVLNLDNTRSTLWSVSNLKSLKRLSMRNNELDNVPVPSRSSALEALDIGANGIVDISPLAYMDSLFELRIDRNRLVDLSPLVGLKNLASLDLSENRIEDVQVLTSLPSLKHANLNGNLLSDLSLVIGSTSLEMLYLRGNQLRSVDFLNHLPQLKHLDLRDNPIEDESKSKPVRHVKILR